MPAQTSGATKRAREQAAAYDSVFASTLLDLEDGLPPLEIPPHPNLRMLDDERQEAYEELMFEVENYDRAPDVYVPEQTLPSGAVLPARTLKGDLLLPYRKDGELVKPPNSIRIVQVALGDEAYGRLRAAGRNASDVWRIWNQQGLKLSDRQDGDQFPNGSTSGLA
jgi:hypothetical protein